MQEYLDRVQRFFQPISDFEETKVSPLWLYFRWALAAVTLPLFLYVSNAGAAQVALAWGLLLLTTAAHTLDARLQGHIPVFYLAKGLLDLLTLSLALWAFGNPYSPVWAFAVLVLLYESIGRKWEYVAFVTAFAALCLTVVTLALVGRDDVGWGQYPVLMATLAFAGFFAAVRTKMDLRLRRTLKEQALLDPLTGLLSRRAFEEQAVAAIAARDEPYGAVVVMDLNGLKELNDNHGHRAGDRALIAFAGRARALFGPGALLARQGGDEFVALVLCEYGHLQAGFEGLRARADELECGASVGLGELLLPAAFAGWSAYLRQRAALAALEAALSDADHRMYGDKARLKGDSALYARAS
jgi:diguanylate cyclase (GGDEF)-like protein